jgi:hypothetical protein
MKYEGYICDNCREMRDTLEEMVIDGDKHFCCEHCRVEYGKPIVSSPPPERGKFVSLNQGIYSSKSYLYEQRRSH